MPRIFLLSPANCSGERARQVLRPGASFDLAARLRTPPGVPLGELFAFVSGLYFRGKLAYARAFVRPPRGVPAAASVLVITPSAGLCPAETRVTRDHVLAFARVDVHPANRAYREPLELTARQLSERLTGRADVILLGSIASEKYVEALLTIFGDRLKFPAAFVGRGDMSRGGLLLRAAGARRELAYIPVRGAVRHGPRPPKLEPLRRPRGLSGRALP